MEGLEWSRLTNRGDSIWEVVWYEKTGQEAGQLLCSTCRKKESSEEGEAIQDRCDNGRFKTPFRRKSHCSKLMVDGKVISDPECLLSAWTGYFKSLSRSKSIEEPADFHSFWCWRGCRISWKKQKFHTSTGRDTGRFPVPKLSLLRRRQLTGIWEKVVRSICVYMICKMHLIPFPWPPWSPRSWVFGAAEDAGYLERSNFLTV